MGERIEVAEVWVEGVNLIATTKDEANARRFTAEVPEGSLTAARLRLADAAERCDKAANAAGWCHTVFGTEEECAAWYAKVGYTEADALAVEQECYDANAEYTAALSALAALRTARGA